MAESKHPKGLGDKLRETQEFDFRENDWGELANRLAIDRAAATPGRRWGRYVMMGLLLLLLGLLLWQNVLLHNNEDQLEQLHGQIDGLHAQLRAATAVTPCDTVYLPVRPAVALPSLPTPALTPVRRPSPPIARVAEPKPTDPLPLTGGTVDRPSPSVRFGALLPTFEAPSGGWSLLAQSPLPSETKTPIDSLASAELPRRIPGPLKDLLSSGYSIPRPWEIGLTASWKRAACRTCQPASNVDFGVQLSYRAHRWVKLRLRYDVHNFREVYEGDHSAVPFVLSQSLESEELRFQRVAVQTRFSQIALGASLRLPFEIEVGGALLFHHRLTREGSLTVFTPLNERRTAPEQSIQNGLTFENGEIYLGKSFGIKPRWRIPIEVFYRGRLRNASDHTLPPMWGLRTGLQVSFR